VLPKAHQFHTEIAEEPFLTFGLRLKPDQVGLNFAENFAFARLSGAKQTENQTGGCAGGSQFVIEPTARSVVGDRRAVQGDQSDYHTTQAVDIEVALTHAL
jgi:hypothetical protein